MRSLERRLICRHERTQPGIELGIGIIEQERRLNQGHRRGVRRQAVIDDGGIEGWIADGKLIDDSTAPAEPDRSDLGVDIWTRAQPCDRRDFHFQA
jgi:hypothetical protein